MSNSTSPSQHPPQSCCSAQQQLETPCTHPTRQQEVLTGKNTQTSIFPTTPILSTLTEIPERSDRNAHCAQTAFTQILHRYLSVVLICRALLSILAPESSRRLPLRSTFRRQALEPRALTSTVPRWRSLESASESVCRACGGAGGARGYRDKQ